MTTISGNPTSNPIIDSNSTWQKNYDNDTSKVSQDEKSKAGALTGQIYDALHAQGGPNFTAVQTAVNQFSSDHGNDAVSKDLQSLLDVAKYEGAYGNSSQGFSGLATANVSAARETAGNSLTASGAQADVSSLQDYANTADNFPQTPPSSSSGGGR